MLPWLLIGAGVVVLLALRFNMLDLLLQGRSRAARAGADSDALRPRSRSGEILIGMETAPSSRRRGGGGGGGVPPIYKFYVQVAISVLLLGSGLWVILAQYPDGQQKWAAGVIGLVAGFWLKK